MCDLCDSGEDGKKARDRAGYMAERLVRLAADYRDLEYSRVKPHTDAMKSISTRAQNIIRALVEEWI